MKNQKMRWVGTLAVLVLWGALTALCWFGPRQEVSLAERRPLAQFPQITGQSVLDGKFMTDFEKFSLDQFPLRDSFRGIKALFHAGVLRQKDSNGIYLADGYAAKLEYPLNETSLSYAVGRFSRVYEMYLKDSGGKVYAAIVPDKGLYLAQENGYPVLDYAAMEKTLEAGMPWASFLNLTDTLSIADYYRTDTHWRQEKLFAAAEVICNAMGTGAFSREELTPVRMERPFYGVYYGQAALPMDPDELYLLEGEGLGQCVTLVGELDKNGQGYYRPLYQGVYDLEKLEGDDLYETYLSGSLSLLRIENPNASGDRELVIFRDSFGSAMAPLLVKDYAAVTLVDIRYLRPEMLSRFEMNWDGDILFLYSTLVLNNSTTLQ